MIFMGIIKILVEFVIMFICSIIQVIGIILEGVSAFFGKLAEYLCNTYDWLMRLIRKKEKPNT